MKISVCLDRQSNACFRTWCSHEWVIEVGETGRAILPYFVKMYPVWVWDKMMYGRGTLVFANDAKKVLIEGGMTDDFFLLHLKKKTWNDEESLKAFAAKEFEVEFDDEMLAFIKAE